jgi:hypothetical protein
MLMKHSEESVQTGTQCRHAQEPSCLNEVLRRYAVALCTRPSATRSMTSQESEGTATALQSS